MQLVNVANNKRKLYLFIRDNKGELQIIEKNDFFPYFYASDETGDYQSYKGLPLRKVFVSNPADVTKSRNNDSYEADVLFVKRYLIDKVDKIDKTIPKYAFIDIEILSDELPNVQEAKFPVSCISVYNSLYKSIQTFYLEDYENDYQLIDDFIKYMSKEKFDLWFSWNVKFDYDYLFNRIEGIKDKNGLNFASQISPIKQSRYGGEVYYPAGISIIDYLAWFKKFTFNRDKSYALDAVAQKHLGKGKSYKPDFSKLSLEIKKRNIEDVEIMAKLEEKFKLIPYYDEIRRLSKVEWEDLIWNSRIIDMLLLKEAKNQKVVLPMKPAEERGTLTEKENYKGAYRDIFETGAKFNCGSYDLSSAYPSMIVDFALDPANVREGVKHNPVEEIEIEDTYFQQNPNALLPTVVKKLMNLKNDIKQKMSSLKIDSEEYKDIKKSYDAIKSVVNSAYGVSALRFFRLFDPRVASATTYLVRDLLHYVEEKIKLKGYKLIYVDTDGIIIDNDKEDISDFLNQLINQWAKEKYGKDKLTTEFSYEGRYEKLLLLAKCRYFGYLKTDKGIEEKMVGIEAKRKDCFDGKTLILTNYGWKYFKDLDKNKDLVLSMNPLTKVANYYPIKDIIIEDYKGKMIMAKNRGGIDFCVTPNHKFLKHEPKATIMIKQKTKINQLKIPTVSLWRKLNDNNEEISLKILHNYNYWLNIEELKNNKPYTKIIKKVNWRGKDLGHYFILTGKNKTKTNEYEEIHIPITNWFEFLGWYLSEGNTYINNNKNIYEIDIAQSEIINPKKCKLIKNLLDKLNVYYLQDKKKTKFQIKNKLIALELEKYGKKARNKFIPLYIKNASPNLIKIFLNSYFLGDGYFKGKQRCFTTSSKQMSLDLQELIVKSGKSATLWIRPEDKHKKWIIDHWANVGNESYQITESLTKFYTVFPNHIQNKYYEGKIYCVNVEPFHTIYVMRNGKSYWTGNSTIFMQKFQRELIDKILNKESKKDILNWIKLQIGRIKDTPLEEIALPCKLSRKPEDYKNVPIFLRALNNTENFNKKVGDPFYYIYVIPSLEPKITTEVYLDGEIKEVIKGDVSRKEIVVKLAEQEIEKGRIKVLHKKERLEDVMAFDEDNKSHINKEQVDWKRMIERNILMKLEVIFSAMRWDLSEIVPDIVIKTPQKHTELPKIEEIKAKPIVRPEEVEKGEINVLSLFDGISCGQIALERAGIKVNKYFASEIEDCSIQITQKNYPNTIQLGDITKIKGSDLPKVDLIIGGSPCQGFSNAGKGLNFDDPRSGLFFHFVRILEECNPTYFLLENVRMKQEWQDIITGYLKVKPIMINSALLTAQSRKRLYWTNISNITQPNDKKLILKDIILEKGIKEERTFLKGNFQEYMLDLGITKFFGEKGNPVDITMKEITTRANKYRVEHVMPLEGKARCLTTSCQYMTGTGGTGLFINGVHRNLDVVECERLQTIPDNYTEGVLTGARYKALGNGWTVDVIAHILGYMKWDLSGIAIKPIKKCTGSPTVRDSKVKVYQNTPKKVKMEDKLPQVIENKEVIEDKREEIKPYYVE